MLKSLDTTTYTHIQKPEPSSFAILRSYDDHTKIRVDRFIPKTLNLNDKVSLSFKFNSENYSIPIRSVTDISRFQLDQAEYRLFTQKAKNQLFGAVKHFLVVKPIKLDDEKENFVKHYLFRQIVCVKDLNNRNNEDVKFKSNNLFFKHVMNSAFNILKNHKKIELLLSDHLNNGHFLFSDLGFCITRLNDHIFAHINKSNFDSGSEKQIKFAININTFELVVCGKKIIANQRGKKEVDAFDDTENGVYNEKLIMERCENSLHIAKIYKLGAYENVKMRKVFQVWMKFYPHGDSFRLFLNEFLDQKKMIAYSLSMAKSVKDIHDNSMTHNDLKPENFLTSDEDNQLLLNDFGLIVDWKNKNKILLGIRGAFLTIAPERLKKKMTTFEEHKKGDIYSLGACFYFLLTGNEMLPWQNNPYAVMWRLYYLKQSEINAHFPEPKKRQSYSHLCWEMLQKDPKMRPDIDEIIARLDELSTTTSLKLVTIDD